MLISHFFRTSIFNRYKKKYGVASTNRSMEKLKVSKLKAGASLSSVVSVLEARQQGSHRQGATWHLSRVREGDFFTSIRKVVMLVMGINFGRSVEDGHNEFDIISRELVW